MKDLRQLHHFLAVADTLHFGRAAERLGMTQPPLSQSILALERELGAALFTRSKRNVALTAFGHQWLEHVRPAVAGIAALPYIARRLREGSAGELALSFVSIADYSLLPALVRHYAARFPQVEVTLAEATSDVQIAALLDGRGHAGIIVPPDGALPDALSYMPLLREPLVAAIPEAWVDEARQRHGGWLGGDWLDRPLILFPRRVAPVFHDRITAYLERQGRPPHVRQEAIQMQTIISLVSAGMGFALVPASMRNLARTGVLYVDLEEAPMLETGLAWRGADDSATLAAFLDVARGIDIGAVS
ncbi:LysR family transcriptional regulator [Rhizorhabdus dicambivorans]|uniref:LysR family transcriptional regulator n=1 Tax=Rhizorhabdus dicambivorans TaxID=1850238 RepID=A0A2A4FWW5_9SPHN|nr:LysR family transcriptional regulator [Rhizorhabdus dicambivorans]ATE65595.1 LysR family transcriptional regulator [Rhizorhabdus dicambivorans]PCE41938.1 LysR family transcriptional regulator [Rhizorhabdus dicambivorans]